MKNIFLLMIIALGAVSCSDTYNVKLNNGSLVSAIDRYERDYKPGDTVCVAKDDNWYIDNKGNMKDTIYSSSFNYRDEDSTQRTRYFIHEYRIGVIR
jgi:hypothetical protein